MAIIPFLLLLKTALSSNSTGTLSYAIPAGEELELDDLVFSSTGAFEVTDIRDSAGRHYTNASSSYGLPSPILASAANQNNALKDFLSGLIIQGNTTLYIDLKDTSGSGNTVNIGISGKRKTS